MKTIRYEEGSITEVETLNILESQYKELVIRNLITPVGYWVSSKEKWTILAIGLDQEPGGYEIMLENFNEVEVH
jgi:hypothetical protein